MTVAPEDRCTQPAAFRRNWPGELEDLICLEHAMDSKKIADAMGLRLPMAPLTVRDLEAFPAGPPQCVCSKGHPQEIVTS